MILLGICLLITTANGQFSLFGGESEVQSIVDQFGMKDAMGVWSKVLRNVARRKLSENKVNPRELLVRPNKVDVSQIHSLSPKAKGEIINEKLLMLLLPRIKGQSAFSTTTTSTTAVSTITETLTSTTPEKEQVRNATTSSTELQKKSETTESFSTDDSGNEISSEEKVTESRPKSETQTPEAESTTQSVKSTTESDESQFTVVFHTANETQIENETKELIETKVLSIIEDKVKEQERNTEKTTTRSKPVKNHKDTFTLEPFIETTTESVSQTSDNEETTTKKTTTVPKMTTISHEVSEEINLGNMLKQKEVASEELVKDALKEDLEETNGGNNQPSNRSSQEEKEEKEETEKEEKEEEEKEEKEEEEKEEEVTEKEEKKEKETEKEKKKTMNVTDSNKDAPTTEETSTTTKESGESVDQSPTMKEKMAKEATEVMDMLSASSGSGSKNEINSRKLLLLRLKNFLEREMKNIEQVEGELDKVILEDDNSTSTVTSTSQPTTIVTEKTSPSEPKTTTSATSSPTTTFTTSTTTTTTQKTSTKPSKKVAKSAEKGDIPEAEEEEEEPEPVNDLPSSDVVETSTRRIAAQVTADTNTTTQTTVAPGATVFNLQSNANSESNPQLTNVITPIAGILDGIRPILMPLLASGGAQRAKTSGVRSYEPYKRNIMENAMSENSLVGFGSQLAREILNPGSLKRERQERERAMAAKIAEVRKERTSKKSLLSEMLSFAQTGSPLLIPTPSPQNIQTTPPAPSQQGVSNLVEALPPPGYSGPLPPPPPPPPPGFIPEGYTGAVPQLVSYNRAKKTNAVTTQNPIIVDGASSASANRPYFPPNMGNMGGAIEGPFPEFSMSPTVPDVHHLSQQGQQERSALKGSQSSNSGWGRPSQAGGGFGGGRSPTAYDNNAADYSFYQNTARS